VRQRRRAQELRQAIDCLPARTREAMLEGIADERIIVGAYTDRKGGVCPMLAAHRHGGRTSLASFARAWDRYTGASKRARPATAREVRTLKAMLEASLLQPPDELAAAAAAHREALERAESASRRRRRVPTGEHDRTRELRSRHGWAWLRIFRRYDEYQAAVGEATAQTREPRERELVN
jgi:hypothetical protein